MLNTAQRVITDVLCVLWSFRSRHPHGFKNVQRVFMGLCGAAVGARARAIDRRARSAAMAAADGTVAVGSSGLSRSARRPDRRADAHGLDLDRLLARRWLLGRASAAAGTCGALVELS